MVLVKDRNIQSSPFRPPKKLANGGQKRSLVHLAHERIIRSLDEGSLAPGDRIVASEVAAQLGLSRAPVREALHVLAGQGLVELLPDRGAILLPMSRRDLAQIYETTAPVAVTGLQGAAERIGEGDNAQRIRAAMDRIRDAAKTTPRVRFYLAMNEYHYPANSIARKPFVNFVMRALKHRILEQAADGGHRPREPCAPVRPHV